MKTPMGIFGNSWEFQEIPTLKVNCLWNLWEYLGTQKDIRIIYMNSWEFPKIPENLSQFGLTTNFYFNSHKGLFPIKGCTLNEFTYNKCQ